ncbi:MAG: WG repeat-containing protein [Planctomycetota bacterium]
MKVYDFRLLCWVAGLAWAMGLVGTWNGGGSAAWGESASETAFGKASQQPALLAPNRRIDPLMLLPIRVDGRWGYCDRTGTVVIGPGYDWVDYFYLARDGTRSQGTKSLWIARMMKQGQMGWLQFEAYERKDTGDLIKASDVREVMPRNEPADRVSEGYVVVQKSLDTGARFHLYQPNEKTITADNAFDAMLRVSNGFVAVERDGRCGFLNVLGDEVIPLRFASVGSFSEGAATVTETQGGETRWGIVDKRGRYRFQDTAGEIEAMGAMREGMVAVRVGGQWGFLNKALRGAVKPTYDAVRDFSGGRAAVREGDAWGYIDKSGQRQGWGFDGAWDYEDFERWGLPDRYKREAPSSVALVQQDGIFGYLNSAGRFAIKPQFELALPFFRGVARGSNEDSFGYIHPSGRVIWDARPAEQIGIRGYRASDAAPVGRTWPGLPLADGTPGEPAPFEYNVPQRLPKD